MGKLNKAILSPVLEDQGTTTFSVAGHNFKMTGENIELTKEVNPTLYEYRLALAKYSSYVHFLSIQPFGVNSSTLFATVCVKV